MEFLQDLLPVVLYFLGGILLIILIILVLKLTVTIDKLNVLLDDVTAKSAKLDVVFDSIEDVGNAISRVNNRITKGVSGFVERLFYKKRKKRMEDDFYE